MVVLIGIFSLVLATVVGIFAIIFRRQVAAAIGRVQSTLFGAFGRRTARTNEPMLVVVGVGFVLVGVVAVIFLVLTVAYPHTFHFHG